VEFKGTATQSELAGLVGISQQAVAKFLAGAKVPRSGRGQIDAKAFLHAYCAHLREQAAGRAPLLEDEGDDGETFDLVKQRARLAKAQADRVEMDNALRRTQMVLAAAVTVGWQTIFVHVRAKMLSLPTKMAAMLAGLTTPAEILEKLTEAVHEALEELSRTRGVFTPDDGGDAT